MIKMRNLFTLTIILVLILFMPMIPVVSAAEWKLSFVERDTMPWSRGSGSPSDASAKLFVYVNNDLAKTFSTIGTDYHYGDVSVNLSDYNPNEGTVTLAFYATHTEFLLYDINLSKNGEMVRFTPWQVTGITENDEIVYDNSLRDDRIVVSIESPGWVNMTTSVINDAPELEIKPSGIQFSKDIYDIEDDDVLDINVTVDNTGSADENNAVVDLYINDNFYQTSSGKPIVKGSKSVFTFSYTTNFNGENKIKVEAEVVPSGIEGMNYNNKVTKYILNHPYFYVRDFSTAPANIFSGEEPYATWTSSLQSEADYALTKDFSDSDSDEDQKALDAMFLALYGNIESDDTYQNKSMEALLFIGDGNWNWANRSNSGNTAEGAGGSHSIYPVNADGSGTLEDSGSAWGEILTCYSMAYDWNFDYIKNYDETHGTNYLLTIRDKLSRMCQDGYLLTKEIYNYAGGGDRTTIDPLGDWGTGKLAMEGAVGVCSLALLDYDGQYQDVERMNEIFEFVEKNLFEEGSKLTGSPESLLQAQVNEDGIWEEGSGYQDYHEPTTSYFMALYKYTLGINLAEVYPLAYGYGVSILRMLYPTTQYPQIASSFASPWYPEANYYLMFDQSDEEYKAGTWYVNDSIAQQRGYRGNYNGDGAGGDYGGYPYLLLAYDKSLPHEPFSEGTYFFPKETAAVMRSGFEKDDLYVLFTAPRNHTMSGHSADTISQLVFDIWSKGAYLVARRGDERFLDPDDTIGRGGFATILVSCPSCPWGGKWKAIDRNSKGIYGDMDNPSIITNTFNSGFLDYVEGNMSVSHFVNLTGSAAYGGDLPFNFNWTRGIMTIGDEYVIVADNLDSDASRDYAMVIPFGETNGNIGGSGSSDNYAWGNLTINGNDYDWYNRNQGSEGPIEFEVSNAQKIIWKTRSETNDIDTIAKHVNLTVFLNPMSDTEIVSGAMHYGTYGIESEWYIPVATVEQSGSDVKYLSVYYPTDVTDTVPTMTDLVVSDGDGNDYATKLTKGTRVDIITTSDGESINTDTVSTNALSTFSRSESGYLEEFFMRGGTTFSYSGNEKISISSEPDTVLVSYDGNDIDMKIKGSGTKTITLKGLDTSKVYAVKRDGQSYSNWEMQNGNADIAITTSLSEHDFEIYVTGDRDGGDGGNDGGNDGTDGSSPPSTSPPSTSTSPPSTYVPPPALEEDWQCTDWYACDNGFKKRVCGDKNQVGTTLEKPVEILPCCEKLEIGLLPDVVMINNGTSVNFTVSADINCDPSSIGLLFNGIESDWYAVNKISDEKGENWGFNINLMIPGDAEAGRYDVYYQIISNLTSNFSAKYDSLVLIIEPASTEEIDITDVAEEQRQMLYTLAIVLAAGILITLIYLIRLASFK